MFVYQNDEFCKVNLDCDLNDFIVSEPEQKTGNRHPSGKKLHWEAKQEKPAIQDTTV